jgi:hypothetical protein
MPSLTTRPITSARIAGPLVLAVLSLLGGARASMPPLAHATTPNLEGFAYQLSHGGTWSNSTVTPVYQQCVQEPPRAPCQSRYRRINVLNVNADFSRKIGALTRAWQRTPVPLTFRPSAASDHQAVVVNSIDGEYDEFWGMRKRAANRRWTAVWGGAARQKDMIRRDGLRVWPTGAWRCGHGGRGRCFLGTSASGIAQVPGVILLDDLRAEAITHPIHFAVRNACKTQKPPATRNDGRGGPDCVQYGAKFKLSPTVDVDAIRTGRRWCAPSASRSAEQAAALGWDPATMDCPLPPLAKMILKAAQGPTYLVATDQAGSGAPNEPGVTFDLESWDRPRTGNWADVPPGDPYRYWQGCDGRNNTGHWSGEPYNTPDGIPLGAGDWESDCVAAQWSAWNGFPVRAEQWYEIR